MGLNPGLWHCRQILYYLSHQGSPEKGLGESLEYILPWCCQYIGQYVLVLKTGLSMSSGQEMVTFIYLSTHPFLLTSDYMYQAVSLLVPPPLLLAIGCLIKHLHSSRRWRPLAASLTWQTVAIIATPRLLAVKCCHLVSIASREIFHDIFHLHLWSIEESRTECGDAHTFSPTCSWWVWWWCALWLFQETKSSFSPYKACPLQHAHFHESFHFFL